MHVARKVSGHYSRIFGFLVLLTPLHLLEDGTPNTLPTKFRVGSMPKQFTAMAVMILENQGKLSTRDSVCRVSKSLPTYLAANHYPQSSDAYFADFQAKPE